MAEPPPVRLSGDDDGFHPPIPGAWWWHETAWFWFLVPERRLGCWLYAWVRPNIGVCGGGCYMWDDSTHSHWESPFHADHHNLRIPDEADLRDITFPTGLSIRAERPLSRYRLGYTDRDRIEMDLVFQAVMEPWVTVDADGAPHHFDQFGRVTGRVVLDGERMDVECLAVRDRSWTIRSERWRDGGGYGYTSAAADDRTAFLAIADTEGGRGFVVLDGERHGMRTVERHVRRHPEHGYVTAVTIDATDTRGRRLEARGDSLSRISMPVPGVAGVVWSSVVSWTINGIPAWGDDQEPWPATTWAVRRRGGSL